MFGGIAAAGADRLLYAAFDGSVVTFDLESGRVEAEFTLFPCAPREVHISACALERPGGAVLLADTRSRRVRRFDPSGRQIGLIGGRATPGLDLQDDPGVLREPCDLLVVGGHLLVACGGYAMAHGVQSFALSGGGYERSLRRPHGWLRAQGLALVGDTIWIAETEAGAIRRHGRGGRYQGDVDLHEDLRRPFRLAHDGYHGVLMLLAPESEAQQEAFGVARLGLDGAFQGWVVEAGERPGTVYCPFDLAVLPDGRFAVADLPYGKPPDVRLQLYSPDGRLLRTLVEDVGDLQAVQRTWFESVLARDAGDAFTLYEQARVHHYHGGAERAHLEEARDLYRAALRADPGFFLAHLGLGTLLQEGLGDPEAAEQAYGRALEAGGPEGDLKARIAACRHDRGDLDGAIALLREAVEGEDRPEDYYDRVEDLGTWFLERAGEAG